MKRIARPLVGVAIASVLVLGVTSAAVGHVAKQNVSGISIPNFSTAQLLAPAGDNWIVQEGNLWGQRYSTLKIITPMNVSGLSEAFHVKLTEPVKQPPPPIEGEAPQLEYNGTLFAEDQYGGIYALNATTGQEVWQYNPSLPKIHVPASDDSKTLPVKIVGGFQSTRGLALGDGKVYGEELGGSVVALNPATGKQVWRTQIAPTYEAIAMAEPPQYYDGMIFGGTSGGDTGFPCIVFALNATTGKMLWKFNLIPNSPSDPGYSTWSHPLTFDGGGAQWSQLGIDPSLGLVYISTGNPIPYAGTGRGPGEEFYTDGQLALHLKTGKLAWFFQEVHHDTWDVDQSQQGLLVNFKYHGVMQKAIVSASKDGLWYVLNRATGKPIIPVTETPVPQSAVAHTWPTQPIPATTPLIPINVPDPAKWKGLVGADGKPYDIGTQTPAGEFVPVTPNQYAVTAAFDGVASGARPAALDPTTGYLIEVAAQGFDSLEALPNSEVAKLSYFNFNGVTNLKFGSLVGTPAASAGGTRLEAMNIATGKRVWADVRLTPSSAAAAKTANLFSGGTLVANGIVWANGGPHLQAFSEATGKLLWSSPALATTSYSPPTVYAVGNTEYITTFDSTTGDLYGFSFTATKA
jgi:glucose dehydrogenase